MRAYLSMQFTSLLSRRAFLDALPGHLPGDPASQDRLPELAVRLQALAQLTA
ncbi:hypothetical protein [Pseudothauera nasutitermitis]|uniref:hypothetical protein n=1 Tax=Pseudothauera nasutitermitis TaxID=2565930 RepID=UPI001454D67A|nr:hypothetical protein [Pseudothauera nasutitermitis]